MSLRRSICTLTLALAGGLGAVAAPAAADPPSVSISAPDIDITTNACYTTPVTATISNSTPSNIYKVTVTDPAGNVVAGYVGAYQADSPIPVSVCSSTIEGVYTATATVSDAGVPDSTASTTFVVFKPHLDVVVPAGARHARSRKVTARLVIHSTAMAHRRVLVVKNGHHLYRVTNSTGRVAAACKVGKRCRISFSYDGFVTSRVVKVRRH